MEYGMIHFRHEVTPDGHHYSYPLKLDGGPVFLASCYIVDDLFKPTKRRDVYMFGPFLVRIIKKDAISEASEFVIEKGVYSWVLSFILGRVQPFFICLNSRILMTLWVWGIADRDPSKYMTWGDVKFIKWLRRK